MGRSPTELSAAPNETERIGGNRQTKPILPASAVSVFLTAPFHRRDWRIQKASRFMQTGRCGPGPKPAVWSGIAADGSNIRAMGSSGGFLLGIAFDRDGNCYACEMKEAAICRFDAATGEFMAFASGGIALPNFPVVDDVSGHLYVLDSFSFDQPGGGVYRYDLATGTGGRWSKEPMHFANCMAMSLDGEGLYVVESAKVRLSFVPIQEDGSPGKHEVVLEGLETVPDGVLVIENDDLSITNYEPSRIYRFSKAKGLELLVEDRWATVLAHTTNIAMKDGNLVTANLGRWRVSHVDLGALE